jgi:hypothetical protein
MFMEPMPPHRDGIVGGGGGGGGGGVRMAMSSRSSSFPIRNDAQYIGYLSDDEHDDGSMMMNNVEHRRRQLTGYDISFLRCLLLFITVVALFLLFLGVSVTYKRR